MSLERTGFAEVMRLRANDLVLHALVITFGMVVRKEVLNSRSQRRLAKEDHPLQTGFLNAANEPLRVRVQVR